MTTVDNSKVSQTSGKDEDPKDKGIFNRPRAGGKTMWDWLNLLGILAIPLVVAGATLLIGIQQANLANQQHEADQKQALDQQQAAILQTYIDNIQDLLLNHNLLGSKPTDDVATLARARTLTALQGLDPDRKGRLVQFIYESQLIGFFDRKNNLHGPIINLSGADRSNALIVATHPSGADLSGVNLIDANLSGAYLIDANLNGVNLSSANFVGTDLTGTNLSSAKITQQQLDQVLTCNNAILPTGLTCHHNF